MSDKQGAPTLPPLSGGGSNNNGGNPGNNNTQQTTLSIQQVLAAGQGLNVITTSGQQFVITSQVPGLNQMITSSTTNAGIQQVGVTRIVNINNQTPRVVGVATSSGGTTSTSSSSTPNRINTTKVVLSTSPKLIKTSIGNMFLTPTSVASLNTSSPPIKKLKLNDTNDKSTLNDDTICYRNRIMDSKIHRMSSLRDKYIDNITELYYLLNDGNMMDYQYWRKKLPTSDYLKFLNSQKLDANDNDEDLLAPMTTVINNLLKNTNLLTNSNEVKVSGVGVTPIAVSTTLPAAVAQLSQQGGTPTPSTLEPVKISSISQAPVSSTTTTTTTTAAAAAVTTTITVTTTAVAPIVTKAVITTTTLTTAAATATTTLSITSTTSTVKTTTTASISTAITSASVSQPVVKLVKLPQQQVPSPTTSTSSSPSSSSLITNDCHNNQEQIVEKAKQEAYVMQRINELQRDGLWSERRLPKIQEPTRTKAHWDYLLEEMVWLAADFAQERKWKKAAAKKCARMVQKHFQEKAIQALKAEKLQELRLKKIAGFVAKEVKGFWTNVEKLVEIKQQTKLEEKRKKALDQHLNFIVGQTEKYSTWLTEGLNKTDGNQSVPASINSSRISSPVPTSKTNSDDEFEPNQCSDDDEETIAKAEEEMKSMNHKEEVELLKKESELPLEDLLKELPPNYLEERDQELQINNEEEQGGEEEEEGEDNDTVVEEEDDDDDEEEKSQQDNENNADDEFHIASGESTDDDEDTIMEQEKNESQIDHKQEIDDLNAENEMSIDELMAKYSGLNQQPMEVEDDSDDQDSEKESEKAADDDDDDDDDKSSSECDSDDETTEKLKNQSDDETSIGLKSLFEDFDKNNVEQSSQSDTHDEMDDVAALAESIQPKGNTLLTTSVVTKIPFLLKHSLREYQHIGLDWLVTMFDRKLNGILADEMGLGKTIQTIALLSHLACEKGNWGPHLIIVPTSVMLNWEMECKKWCPGFKILTYYGTQKERKQKRTGWTKPNAFHICITSYKLVIQDHQSFRRKKWKYLILDEAQNIKNFKSQRWQLLLNFQTQRRLLLTGTPLQNNLMELWSLMHFLMPNVFQSHREFKEWFSNPVTGMIEGNNQFNENVIRRLHKVLRPFLLRRLKCEVEKQLPKKYEHVIMCRLSKRQRFLYDDFMSRAKTKETLASGNLLSVINVLMQLRKVCNHPNLFEVRPTVSPFRMEVLEYITASLVWNALDYDPMKHVDLNYLNLNFINYEKTITAFASHRVRKCQVPRKLIEEIDTQPLPPPKCPSGKIKINVRLSNQVKAPPTIPQINQQKFKNITSLLPSSSSGNTSTITNKSGNNGQGVTLRVASGQQLQGYAVQILQHQCNVKAIPVAHTSQVSTSLATTTTTTTSTSLTTTPSTSSTQRITVSNPNMRDGIPRLTVKSGENLQRINVPSFAQFVHTPTGRQIILTSSQSNTSSTVSFPVITTTSGQRLTVLSPKIMGLSSAVTGRPVMRVPPLNVTTTQSSPTTLSSSSSSSSSSSLSSSSSSTSGQLRCGIVTKNIQKDCNNQQQKLRALKEAPKSEFYIQDIDNERRKKRINKLQTIANINSQRCSVCPLYGDDLFMALRIDKPSNCCKWNSGWLHIKNTKKSLRTRNEYFSTTNTLNNTIKTTDKIVDDLKVIFDKYLCYVPAVTAPMPRIHVSHPSQHKYNSEKYYKTIFEKKLVKKIDILHPIISSMMTQFPDPRLIQYDCGKLQSLDNLLRKLKTDYHRVLLFTQMTRMLDVLEAFLNYHGYIYLRLDGTTKIDQRQLLMERFNNDKRIFCFILSTRSGGVGVNLTGADTVIFYDSDWNPTMDAQAQDRCHRIGQTRDVHIYRLISEKTIEENILKKANQKRMLGEMAIENGNFTTAYFKSSTIQDLFNVDNDGDATTRMADVVQLNKEREKNRNNKIDNAIASGSGGGQQEEKIAMGALESALAAVEEDLDVQAAKIAKAEAVADLAEFDENIPLDDYDKDDQQISKAELEVQTIISQLKPIERYAMHFVEETEDCFSAAQLAAAEAQLEQQKRDWEIDRLRALREEEDRRMRMTEDDDKSLTYTREDAQNQVNKRLINKKQKITNLPIRRSSRRQNSFSSSVSSSTSATLSETETKLLTNLSDNSDLSDDNEDDDDRYLNDNQIDIDNNSNNSDNDNDDDGNDNDDEDKNSSQYISKTFIKRKPGRPFKNSKLKNNNIKTEKINNEKIEVKNKKNHLDLNSPRTRSRGDVKINLWTLDVSPILPVRMRKRIDLNKRNNDDTFDTNNTDNYDTIDELETNNFDNYLHNKNSEYNESHDTVNDDDNYNSNKLDNYKIDDDDNSCKKPTNNLTNLDENNLNKIDNLLDNCSHDNTFDALSYVDESISSNIIDNKANESSLNIDNNDNKKTSDNDNNVEGKNNKIITEQCDDNDVCKLKSSSGISTRRSKLITDTSNCNIDDKKPRRTSTRSLTGTSDLIDKNDNDVNASKTTLTTQKINDDNTILSSSSTSTSSTALSVSKSRVTRSTSNTKTNDNGFLIPQKRSRSNSRLIDIKKSSSTDNNTIVQLSSFRKRPDTPMPRITRSTIDTNNSDVNKKIKLTTNKKLNNDLSMIIDNNTTTDTNGNVDINIINDERPQRTAKVVAILSLDTHSRYNCNKIIKKIHNDDKKNDNNHSLKNNNDVIDDVDIDNDKKNRKNLRKNSSLSRINF